MTEMDAVCIRYRPPDPPIFSDTPKEAKDRMLKLRNESPSYQYYAKLCNITDADSTHIGTSTLSLTASSGGQGWIAAVVIVIVLIIAAVVVVAWIIKRKKTRDITHLCDLQSHENVNYLNNKAEKGEKWAGAHQNVNYLDNKSEKGEKWKGNPTNTEKWDSEKPSKNQEGVHNANINVQNNMELSELSLRNGHNLSHHSKQVPQHQRLTDDEVIYANSQFEKVAKAACKKLPLEKTPSGRDITPPVDKKTLDMYYIDENPYDRVDRRERPVPKKRNKVMHQDREPR